MNNLVTVRKCSLTNLFIMSSTLQTRFNSYGIKK